MHSLLSGLFRIVLSLFAAAPVISCQLQIRGSTPLAELVRHTVATLAGDRPDEAAGCAHDLARLVLVYLRLGERDAARSRLRAFRDVEDPGLVLAAHATFLRTTGELVLTEKHRLRLERALALAEQTPHASYRSAALLVHGRYCLGQIVRGESRIGHERLATARLLALESETWQPGRGHYRPTPCNGALLVPEAADASLLIPLSFGMLIASGNRLTRHLDSTLKASRLGSRHRWRTGVFPDQLPALRLLAAAQLGDPAQIASAYREVVGQRATDIPLAALNLDAVLQAVTGIRIAAGAGFSDRWLHVKPWLPTGCAELELRGLWAQQHRLGLSLRRAEQGAATSVEVQLEHPRDVPLQLVVANRWQQFVTTVANDAPFRCELPDRQPLPARPETNHDALHRLGFRAR